MTLPEVVEEDEEVQQQTQEIGQAVVEMVKQGAADGRLVCGLDGCVQVLNSSPDEVMLCLLPTSATNDVTINIQHILVRAFCLEYNIKLLNVDSDVKLYQLVYSSFPEITGTNKDVIKTPVGENSSGFSCILIEYPKHGLSEDDEAVATYFKNNIHLQPQPYVELPD